MKTAATVIWIAILCSSCSRSTPEGATAASEMRTAISDQVSHALIGKEITIRGKFSLGGKIGPYILLDNRQEVYLVPTGSFIWGKPYSEMQGKLVTATGVLRFYKDVPTPEQKIQHAPDHFYFEAETTQVQLAGP